MAASIQTRVARGIKFLDREFPNWYRTIKIKKFDFADSCQCVIGQIFPPDTAFTEEACKKYKLGTAKQRARYFNKGFYYNIWVDYGFDWQYYGEMKFLQAEWLKRIREYRKEKH